MTIDTRRTQPTRAARFALGLSLFGLSSTVTACAVVWGFEDPQDPAESPALVGDGSIAEGRAPGCEQEKPDENAGVFVVGGDAIAEAGAVEDPLCGAKDVPCIHIATGLSRAKDLGRALVYVVRGTYTESISVPGGITLQGGWNALRTGATINYARACGDAPGTTVIIQAPETQPTAVLVDDVQKPVTLTDLTIKSKTKPLSSESVYGVRVRGVMNTPAVTLTDVFVVSGAGGNGDPGKPATPGAPATGGCTPPTAGAADAGAPPSGDAGATGAPPPQGKFGPDGIAASNGTDGATGARGENGTAADPPTPLSCFASCTPPALLGACTGNPGTPVTGKPGDSGCGGAGGGGGHGGGGGGSSVAVYAWNATITTTRGGLTSGNGGSGAVGSAGASGGAGAQGATGGDSTATCIVGCGTGVIGMGCSQTTDKSKGTAGTKGSAGGNGGAGSGGAGGDSYAIALGGTAKAQVDASTVLVVGVPGGAPMGGVPGKAAAKGAP